MNQPDRYSRFTIPEDIPRVEFAVEGTNKCAAAYTIRLEDHTLGNLLRQQLHTDDDVVFAGYRIPHPLDPLMVMRIQTTGNKMPHDALHHAIRDLQTELGELKAELQSKLPRPPNPYLQPQADMQQPHTYMQQDQYAGQGYAQGSYGYGY